MNDIRKLIYLHVEGKKVISYGIEFKEFMAALNKQPNNILVMKGHFGTHYDFNVNREYCTKEDFDEFVSEDVYSYGNFSWVDFEEVSALKELSDQDIAELYFFSNKWAPLNDSYFEKLNNRFFYNAHDDGWINWTYFNNIDEFFDILKHIIESKIQHLNDIRVAVSDDGITKILNRAKQGVALSFSEGTEIPVYELDKYTDMDLMVDDVQSQKPDWILKVEMRRDNA